jgi:type I restriction enzyme S subunit
MVVRPKDSRITIALLKYAFLGGIKISDAISGTAQPQITRTSLSPLKICFPTARAQQDQLAKKLDEAFAGLAKAKENAAQNLQNARALFESCLDQIFSENARKWPRRTIGEIAEVYDGPHATPKTVGEGPIFLGISSLNDGKINLGETRHVTPSDFKKWTRRVKPKTDDVVFSYETRLGQAAVVPKDMECCLGRRMGLVRLKHEVCDPFFFVYQYISPPFRSFLKSKTIKGTTVDRISLREFPSFPISLPGIDEQRRLVEKILFVQVEIQKLSSVYNHKNAGVAELKKSILHEAFSGNL